MSDTTYCPCDQCNRFKKCTEECKSFISWTNGVTDTNRKEVFNNFIQLQSLSIPHKL